MSFCDEHCDIIYRYDVLTYIEKFMQKRMLMFFQKVHIKGKIHNLKMQVHIHRIYLYVKNTGTQFL